MNTAHRTSVDVKIMGESVKMSGNESADYIRRIADYIDEKVSEIQASKKGMPVHSPLFKLLVYVNIVDDLFRERAASESLKKELTKARTENAKLRQEAEKYKLELKEYDKMYDQ